MVAKPNTNAPGEHIGPTPADPASAALVRVVRAESEHAALIKKGAPDLAIHRAFIVALIANRDYIIACGEDATAVRYRIEDEQKALARAEARQ